MISLTYNMNEIKDYFSVEIVIKQLQEILNGRKIFLKQKLKFVNNVNEGQLWIISIKIKLLFSNSLSLI